jgi:hypothetical protein
MSESRQTYGAFSNSNIILRFTLIASSSAAMNSSGTGGMEDAAGPVPIFSQV